MRKLLPFALVLCSGLPLFAIAAPRSDTTIYIQKDTPSAAIRPYVSNGSY